MKGVTAEVQRQVDRRTKKYDRDPEELQIGRATKKASLLTWDQLKENNKVDYRKVAGKF